MRSSLRAHLGHCLLLAVTYGCSAATVAEAPASVTPARFEVSPTLTFASSPALPFNPSIEVTGEREVVFRWATDRCDDRELADLPARAIRTADGRVALYVSSTTSFRLIGEDFDSLKSDCSPVLISDFDRDPSHFNYAEWIGAPYTLDGMNVIALVHQEYHGDQAGSVWQAEGDFGSVQGGHHWSYLSSGGGVYREMAYDAANHRWQGSLPLCQITSQAMHPDLGCDPVRAWTSPIEGPVTISGRVYDQDPNGGNGVTATIAKGGVELWSATIQNGDTQGQSFDFQIQVQEGDVLSFSINARGDAGWDSTYFDPGINVGPAPCPSNRHDMCTLISLTYAASTDGGASFLQPEPPHHLIATLPYTYDPDWMRSAWQPSNIVRNPNDGYYYALVQRDEHSADGAKNLQGMCVMRTQTLDDPASWRAWDGNGFEMRFVNPYLEPDSPPHDHTCALVSPEVGALTYGLSYNTYFGQFIAVGVGQRGFFYSLSEDLVHWTPRVELMQAAQTFTPGAQPPYFPYPTLIDHDSPSASFDVTGQQPYLYFSRFNGGVSAADTDILRVRLELHR